MKKCVRRESGVAIPETAQNLAEEWTVYASTQYTIEEIADRFGKLDFQSQKPFFEGQTRKRSIFIHVSDSLLVSNRIFKYIYFFFKLQRLIVGHYDDNVRFRRPSLERSFLFVF